MRDAGAELIDERLTEQVLVLAAADRAALGAVRHLPGLHAAEAAGRLWLRGLPPSVAALPPAVRALPAAARYGLDAQGRLFEPGRRAPPGRLPALAWQPLRELLPLELPTAALPAQPAPTYALRLVPSRRAEAGAALLTTLAEWRAYAETAPEIRLAGLRFAACADGRVLVLGAPLPPLPGQEHWQPQARLLLPAGFDFEAPLLAPLLAARLNPAADAWLLFAPDGGWEQVPDAHLVPASRSAVRLTVQEFGDE